MSIDWNEQPRAPEGRVRRSTLERFNEELAVLDRPLEEEIEYYDDPPPPSAWSRLGAIAGAAALLGIGAFALVHRSGTASAEGQAPRVAVAVPAVAPSGLGTAAVPAPPVPTQAPSPAIEPLAVPAPAGEAPGDDSSEAVAGDSGGPWRLQPSRRAWANLKPASAHGEPARAAVQRSRSRHHGRHR